MTEPSFSQIVPAVVVAAGFDGLPSSPEIAAFYGAHAPVGVSVPFGRNRLMHHEVQALAQAQIGPRRLEGASAQTARADWDPAWLVIGVREPAVLVANTGVRGTPVGVLAARGEITPLVLMAPTLSEFLSALSVWVETVSGRFDRTELAADLTAGDEFLDDVGDALALLVDYDFVTTWIDLATS